MKRQVLWILCIFVLLTGCTKNVDKQIVSDDNEAITTVKSESEQEQIMEQFNTLLNTSGNEKEIIEFVENNIQNVSKENANTLVLGVESSQLKHYEQRVEEFYVGDLQAKIAKHWEDVSVNNIDKLEDVKLRKFLQEARQRGYKVICEEGMFYPIIDYELYKRYNDYVSDAMRAYIKLQATESNEIATSDAALVISWDEIFNRVLQKEDFINAYPEFIKTKEVKEQYLSYVAFYLYGINNTPAFDYFSNTLEDKLKESYLSVDLGKKESRITKIISEYLPILKQSNYKLTTEVQEYRDKVMGELEKAVSKG